MQKLRSIVEKYEEHLSRADIWILCALTALEISTSRTYPMIFIGRQSCADLDSIGHGGEKHDIYGDEVHTYIQVLWLRYQVYRGCDGSSWDLKDEA